MNHINQSFIRIDLFVIAIWCSLAVCTLAKCPSDWRVSLVLQNKCYKVMTAKKIWFDAEEACRNSVEGGHLTSVSSAFENSNINAIVMDTPLSSICDYFWIGGNDFAQSRNFTWIDNKSFQYSNWQAGQPDAGDCVATDSRSTGKWRSDLCGIENCFICELFVQSFSTTMKAPATTSIHDTTTSTKSTRGTTVTYDGKMTDCSDWLHLGGQTTNGIYRIEPPGLAAFDVLCDMTTDGGGWTHIQKRVDGSLEFYMKTWSEYKTGFNDGLERNHWLGLDRIHVLSNKDPNVEMRVELNGDRCIYNDQHSRCSNQTNGFWFGTWNFTIADESDFYRLKISWAKNGNLTINTTQDSFYTWNYNGTFNTFDHDVTQHKCALNTDLGYHFGGWWYNDCTSETLNGQYDAVYPTEGVYWIKDYINTYPGIVDELYKIIPVRTAMKIRRF